MADPIFESGNSHDKIIDMIAKQAKLNKTEVVKLIQDKQEELSGLVSLEGAAYIVGRELGVNLLKETKRQLKIINLVSGMRTVDILGKVIRMPEKREFESKGKRGHVLSLHLGDDTGSVRFPLWNEEIAKAEEIGLKVGDVIKVSGGFVKMDYQGNPELRLGTGKIEKVDKKIVVAELPDIKHMEREFITAKRGEIRELKEGSSYELRGCLVQTFKRSPFFEICPECSSRLTEDQGKWVCKEHGAVQPEYQMVISAVMDDGTGNIRVVFFRDLAEKVMGENVKGLKQLMDKGGVDELFKKLELGKDIVVRGKVKKNNFTEKLELVASEISDVDLKKESEDILKSLDNQVKA